MIRLQTTNADKLDIDPWCVRSLSDRRNSAPDRRKKGIPGGKSLFKRDRRKPSERRYQSERRDGWLRVGRWHSVSVFER